MEYLISINYSFSGEGIEDFEAFEQELGEYLEKATPDKIELSQGSSNDRTISVWPIEIGKEYQKCSLCGCIIRTTDGNEKTNLLSSGVRIEGRYYCNSCAHDYRADEK